jgi:hypothetical protein
MVNAQRTIAEDAEEPLGFAVSFQGELVQCSTLDDANSIAAANEAMDRLDHFSAEQLRRFAEVLHRHQQFDASYRLMHIARRLQLHTSRLQRE